MRRSKAKEQILETARMMFCKTGYAALNVNEVAELAGVSIGTLYYHFPRGKVSILLEIRERIRVEYEAAFRERLGLDFLSDVTSFDEGLEALLDLLIEIHREQRFILAAIDSEVLGNLAVYDELVKEVDVGNLMSEDARPVLDVLNQMFKHYPKEGLELKDGVLACRVMDVLIHRYIYLEYAFNTEQKFKEIIIKIMHSLFQESTSSSRV